MHESVQNSVPKGNQEPFKSFERNLIACLRAHGMSNNGMQIFYGNINEFYISLYSVR